MLEYIQFYTKNLSNFTILLLIGVIIAILDITLRNVVTGVYRNVRENMRLRHGGGGGGGGGGDIREGMENKKGGGSGDDESGGTSGESCPKDCNAVEAMKTKLTGLIENAAKLQKEIQNNNEVIKQQQLYIEIMQRNVQKLAQKRK